MKTIKHTSKYKVGSGQGQVHLRVVIGEGQFGSSSVVVGASLFPQVRTFDENIGLPAELNGKLISAISVVTDTNKQTNLTSVTYELSGGPQPFGHSSEVTVDRDGDSVMFIAEIQLEA